MRHSVRGSLVLGLLIVTLSASASFATTLRETPVMGSWNSAPQGATCVGFCMFCSLVEDKYQVTPNDDLKNDEDEDVTCGHHTECATECRMSMREDVDRITRVVAISNDKALQRLLREVEGVTFNQTRRALQLKGCNPDEVVLHLPLTEHQAALLSNLAASDN